MSLSNLVRKASRRAQKLAPCSQLQRQLQIQIQQASSRLGPYYSGCRTLSGHCHCLYHLRRGATWLAGHESRPDVESTWSTQSRLGLEAEAEAGPRAPQCSTSASTLHSSCSLRSSAPRSTAPRLGRNLALVRTLTLRAALNANHAGNHHHCCTKAASLFLRPATSKSPASAGSHVLGSRCRSLSYPARATRNFSSSSISSSHCPGTAEVPHALGVGAMAAIKIDGTAIAKRIRERLRNEIAQKKQANPRYQPSLRIIQIGDRSDSSTYVRMKLKAAEEVSASEPRAPSWPTVGVGARSY
ncbi:hypothetical protein B0T24DRAFT_70576 [Lasiosphaeria ovina]|uniref:Tetrahydrofolate dehydrogenase/cyclohydrolase catalytic domain-containing protein n=1 Tax=Lasiosphaeria ovina TaxID=92902 RepID=A0AAE0NM05_9PEZI|nr:hypothetical protein B0T24DRAFT_70576 [Lasiosphaeria ovina]